MFVRWCMIVMVLTLLVRAEEVTPYEEESLWTGNKIHKYLGIGAVTAGVLTAFTPPENEEGTQYAIHRNLAYTTVVLATGAVVTGLIEHMDDVNLEYGTDDPDNIHVTLGAGGALLMLGAVMAQPGDAHPTLGALGLAAMAVSIKITW